MEINKPEKVVISCYFCTCSCTFEQLLSGKIPKSTHLENFFHHINNLYQNIKFTMEEESNGELAFLDTLLKRNNG